MFENVSCPKCGAPISSTLASALLETCRYCGSTFKRTPSTEGPLVCGCGRGGENRCALCTTAICQGCSTSIEHYDLSQIMLGHRIPPRHHSGMLHRLGKTAPLSAVLCVPCLDSTLTNWLRTHPNTL